MVVSDTIAKLGHKMHRILLDMAERLFEGIKLSFKPTIVNYLHCLLKSIGESLTITTKKVLLL